jgi:hypothetical protein
MTKRRRCLDWVKARLFGHGNACNNINDLAQDIAASTACNNFNRRNWEICMRALVTLLSALALVATAALAQESGPKGIAADAVKWGPAPDALPKGGQLELQSLRDKVANVRNFHVEGVAR